MRGVVLFMFLLLNIVGMSQMDTLEVQDSLQVELNYESLPELNVFTGDTIQIHKNRIASLHENDGLKDQYFYGVVGFTLFLVIFFLSTKELVLDSFKSFLSFQYNIQYSRSDKQNNLIYLLIYYLLFIIGLSVVIHFVLHNFFASTVSLASLFLICTLYFIWDYLAANLYYLFAVNSKSIDLVKSVILTFSPLWTFIVCLALFFVVLPAIGVSKLFSLVLLSILGVVLLAKEIRVLQVLNFEKIEILSFHFFAYLCTFKILPFILLVWLIF